MGNVRDLAHFKPETVLHQWFIPGSLNPQQDIAGWDKSFIIGRRICQRVLNRMTEPIVYIDPASNRVMAQGGKVYELGLAEALFARHNSHVLEEIGINCCD